MTTRSLSGQRTTRPRVGTAAQVVAAVVGSALFFVVLGVQDRASVGSLTRDPTVTAGVPWYTGIASSVGSLGWASAAAVATFGAVVVRHQDVRQRDGRGLDRPDRTFSTLGGLGAFSALLWVDDVLLLHDDVLYRIVDSELPVYAVYAALFVGWVWWAWPVLSTTSRGLLVVACVPLGASVLIDLLWDTDRDLRLLLEDGAKFCGIWLWALFAVHVALAAIVGEDLDDGVSHVPSVAP